MRRREFLRVAGGAAASWPVVARAQQTDRMRRIGVLMALKDEADTQARIAAFRKELERLGWSEGRNVSIDYRLAGANSDQYQRLAKELIASRPDVIFAQSSPVVAVMQRETHVVPIVFVNVSDPIGSGFIANLARPGGNMTGVLQYEPGIVGKWLGMLKEIAPQLSRAALLESPKTSTYDYFLRSGKTAASALSLQLVPTPVEDDAGDIERVIALFAHLPNGGVVIPPGGTTIAHRDHLISLMARHRLPAVYPFRSFVAAGGLMSYGIDQADLFRLAAAYVDRVLRGEKPADLPVQTPTKYETVVNLKVAKALGFTVPPGLLVGADEVIE